MKIEFTKMHGLGNDFVVLNAVTQPLSVTPAQVRFIADRHVGIGCDQVLLVEKPTSATADFKYRIFNADGSEVAQCGNGARCFARFVRDKKLSTKEEIRVDTDSGQLLLKLTADGLVTVNMGIPRHLPAEIPLQTETEALLYHLAINGQVIDFGAVSMGNPHAVIQVADVNVAPLETVGVTLERHPFFPQRANIGFMQIIDRQHIKLRVFERGAGETLACGSGACAAVVIGREQQLLDEAVTVQLPGGELQIRWAGRGTPVEMTGPAVSVFEGQIAL